MAEKGFGVKEVNLIGASGTPTITSPNNLNLNAVNVAISTNVSIGGALSVTGNVSVGGTLTYEDVTNIDSVGLITARSGVSVNSGGIQVLAGVSRFNANIIGTATTAISVTAADESSDTSCNVLFATAATGNVAPKTGTNLTFNSSNGTLTATTFSGSGASLTNLPVADSDIQVAYTVTANGSSAYRFAGNGVVSSADNPDLYLMRGQKYRFINNSGGSHPFQIRVSNGGSAYSTGVTNNGAASGNIDFAPTFDSPSQLVYQCTSHSGMVGNIYISDGKYDTNPTKPCFAAKGTTSHTAGSVTHIDYTQQLFDNGGNNYDPTAGQSKFTAPVSGYYFFHATCMFDSNLSGFTYCFLDFKIDGNTQGRENMMPRPSGGNFATIENSAIFYLTANQYVQVYITQNGGNPMNVRSDYRFFEGYLIG